MKRNKLWLLFLPVILLLSITVNALEIGNVSLVWESPASGAVIGGTQAMNISANITGLAELGGLNITSLNITTGTAVACVNSTKIYMSIGRNSSICQANTALQPDNTSAVYTVTAYNSTNVIVKTLSRTFIVDNTRPDPSISTTKDTTLKDSDYIYATDSKYNATTSMTLFFDSSQSFTMTRDIANTRWYYQLLFTDSVPDGTYDAYARGSDGTNSTDSAKVSLVTRLSEEKQNRGGISDAVEQQQIVVQQQAVQKKSNSTAVIIIIGLVVILVLYGKNGGKK